MEHKYKFSVIMAVYNVELYLNEAVESVIEQDIGFNNVQLILVDDGTPDKSGEICDEYAAKYSNITVIHKENGGVSSARNRGLEVAEGKYVNFLDPDDMILPDTLSKIWTFFESHYDETDAVAIRMTFFDGRKGGHILNYKFKGESRVVDLEKEWDYIQLSMSSAFVKREAIGDLRFDTRLSHCEDAKVMQKILLEKQTMGVVTDTSYMYRRRTDGIQSAVQGSTMNYSWYIPTVKFYGHEVLNYALERLGKVPKFIQFILMYDLQWRFKMAEIPEGVLTEAEKEEYLSLIKGLLQYFDDDVILAQRHIYRDYKYHILALKYGTDPQIRVTRNNIIYSFSQEAGFKFSTSRLNFEMLNIVNNVLSVEGMVTIIKFPFKSCELAVSVNGEFIKCTNIERNIISYSLGENISKAYGFKVDIPLKKDIEKYKIEFYAVVDGVNVPLCRSLIKGYMPISTKYENAYVQKENWIVSMENNCIFVYEATLKRRIAREAKLLWEMLFSKVKKSRKAIFNRLSVRISKAFRKKTVWLISDRAAVAGDNGEAFFRYMVENHKEIDARFVIERRSEDYKKLSKIGPVVKRNSRKHKMLAIISDYIISSHAEEDIYNPCAFEVHGVKDFWSNTKFIFLQHGVTKDDLSGWLNKYNKNFTGFVVSAKDEYDSMFEYDYFYPSDNVWLTGLPRFDRLYDDSQKIVTIMPTWRKNLTLGLDHATGVWRLVEDFEESEFFKFYNSLMNHPKIMDTVKKTGYKIEFLLHPNLRDSAELFDKNDFVTIIDSNVDYNRQFAISNLILTDYSSTVFDFAYLRKPVFYTHFDKDTFFDGSHSYKKGYFEYERDGFGEVEYDLDSTVDRIIEYMENDCRLKDKYRERIDNFFAFNDKNNCQRVYEKIVELSKK